MKTIDATDLSSVTGGNLASTSTRPGLLNPSDRPWMPKLPSPTKPAPTVPLGPFYPDDSKRLIA